MSDHVTTPPEAWRELCTICSTVPRPAAHVSPLPLTVRAHTDGEYTVVTASGELDFDSTPTLGQILHKALEHSADGVELDLKGIGFCDCSGLNLLLQQRRRARDAAKTLTVRVSGPAMQRLLDLTGTVDVLTASPTPHAPGTPGREPAADTAAHSVKADTAAHSVEAENEQLRHAIEARPIIDIARGILMASYTLTAEQAWHVLVSTSQNSNVKLRLLAEELMNTVHGEKLPEPLAGHLAKALHEHGGQPL